MNDMRALTKIILGSLGIYLLIQMIPSITNTVALAYSGFTFQMLSLLLLIPGIVLLWAFLILSVFLLKRERAVRWITKDIPAQTQPAGPTNWIYFAYRLICFIAGLLLCYRFIIWIPSLLLQIPLSLSSSLNSCSPVPLQFFNILLPLPVGIYLLCGAPQFVRWQVSKILEMCKEYNHCSQDQSNPQS